MPQPDDLPLLSPHVATRIQALDAALNDSLDRQDTHGSSKLLYLIKRMLKQFHLESFYSESDILVEAYLRTYLCIEKGKVIDNLPGWLYYVAFNIVREYSRLDVRNKKILANNTLHLEAFQSNTDTPVFINEYTIELLVTTLQQMSADDREILQLRVGQGLSWKAVREHWVKTHRAETTESTISESTLRKKGERALERLQQAFYANQNNAPF